jgi:hypothetical protein
MVSQPPVTNILHFAFKIMHPPLFRLEIKPLNSYYNAVVVQNRFKLKEACHDSETFSTITPENLYQHRVSDESNSHPRHQTALRKVIRIAERMYGIPL